MPAPLVKVQPPLIAEANTPAGSVLKGTEQAS